MNTDIDFMKIAKGDKEFVRDFENFVDSDEICYEVAHKQCNST